MELERDPLEHQCNMCVFDARMQHVQGLWCKISTCARAFGARFLHVQGILVQNFCMCRGFWCKISTCAGDFGSRFQHACAGDFGARFLHVQGLLVQDRVQHARATGLISRNLKELVNFKYLAGTDNCGAFVWLNIMSRKWGQKVLFNMIMKCQEIQTRDE